jgi:hypothetical protein
MTTQQIYLPSSTTSTIMIMTLSIATMSIATTAATHGLGDTVLI